jgi:hypothetical protein
MTHSWLFGHLHIITELMGSLPSDVHPNYIPELIMKNWRRLFPDRSTCPGILYLDMWPMGQPIIFTIHPEFTTQFTSGLVVPRSKAIQQFIKPLTGNLDLLSSDDASWKLWRSIFNPSFSAKNITALVPIMLDELTTFRGILTNLAGKDGSWGEVFQLEEPATKLTLDVIGRAALYVDSCFLCISIACSLVELTIHPAMCSSMNSEQDQVFSKPR